MAGASMNSILMWSVAGYLVGSIPFAVLIGRLVVKVDPRTVGDGNPGGTNVWKAGGWKVGMITAIVEILKGFFPVYLARQAGLAEWALIPVGLAPILGHATQPFLGWHGGKALGTTGGVWVALIGLWAFPVYAAGALTGLAVQKEHAYAALSGMLMLIAWALFFDRSAWLIAFSLLNNVLIFWTHREALGRDWQWRSWLTSMLQRREA
jgi:glycerol-3-phosphate acyltransferase PlsY